MTNSTHLTFLVDTLSNLVSLLDAEDPTILGDLLDEAEDRSPGLKARLRSALDEREIRKTEAFKRRKEAAAAKVPDVADTHGLFLDLPRPYASGPDTWTEERVTGIMSMVADGPNTPVLVYDPQRKDYRRLHYLRGVQGQGNKDGDTLILVWVLR